MIRTVTPAQVFRQLLIDRGHGVADRTTAWAVTTIAMPDTPDECLTAYTTTPVKHGRLAKTKKISQHYGVSLRIRCKKTNGSVGELKGQAIGKDLEQVDHLTMTVEGKTVLLKNVVQIGGVNYINQEEQNQRHLFTMNFLLDMTESGEGVGE